MSLESAILVALAEEPASGYDLARRFDTSYGFFWSATHQQIYRVLAKMEATDLVAVSVESSEGRPNRRVHHLTETGRQRILEWTREPTPPQQLRSEFAVKVRAMPFGDRSAIVEDIRRQRRVFLHQAGFFREAEALHFPDATALGDAELAGWLTLRGGMRVAMSRAAWCDEMLLALGEPTPDEPEETT
ncbi:PadR family transcriptional regulator [Rudaeicoccus suwonensis]|uniref:PadR family transcriptional regulator n=1 Tax=Rudaeicoccus suwonensis TaxID=657409 RepID=A0A561E7T7_9MICO|nr:PadR family transcriptional regulator [Rudaeicoccus suwonensis]TWE11677.1 PadR family transcriptional regulator [Rudaeicoccus suwonensis]